MKKAFMPNSSAAVRITCRASSSLLGKAITGTGPPTWKEVWRLMGSSRRSSRDGTRSRRR